MKIRSKRRRGAVMVEYALLVTGIALICTAAVAMLGHKTNDLLAAVATVLPSSHAADNQPITSSHLIEVTASDIAGQINLDITQIAANNNTDRLATNTLGVGTGQTYDATLIINSGSP